MDAKQAEIYNERFCSMPAFEVLEYFVKTYKESAVFTSSLGAEDQVITEMISNIDRSIDIITLDTGRHFNEIYELIEKTNARYKVHIKVVFPDAEQVEKMVNTKGVNLFYESIENRKLCCNIRKIIPLKRVLKEKSIWITGLRKDQSVTRTGNNMVELDIGNSILKINPLIHWTEEQVWSYIKKKNIPYNPLHDQNYPSVGCQPCTRAVQAGDDLRSGRWWWELPESKECGLHGNLAAKD